MYGVLFYHYFRLVILLLKVHRIQDFVLSKCHPIRCDHPFSLHIVRAVDDGDDSACELLYRIVHTEDIGILFLAVRCYDALDITVIDGVIPILVFWMKAAERAVYGDGDEFAERVVRVPSLCINPYHLRDGPVSIHQILPCGEAHFLPEGIAGFVPVEYHKSCLVDAIGFERCHTRFHQCRTDALFPAVRMHGGMVDIAPASVIADHDAADNSAHVFGNKAGIGITFEKMLNALSGIIQIVQPHAFAGEEESVDLVIVGDVHLSDVHDKSPFLCF